MADGPIPTEQLRPLVHQLPVERDGKLVFELPAREVAIGGDLEFVRAVLSRCDARRTVAEIAAEVTDGGGEGAAEVVELVASLVEQGAASDCTQAWRHFHRQSSISAGLFRRISEAEILALMEERFQAPHTSSFHSLSPLGGPLAELARRRRSARAGEGARAVSFEELSALLALMYGRPPDAGRPVPSGGAIYPLVIHVLVRRPVGPLESGLWWYEPERGGLWLVRDGDLDADALLVSHPQTDALLAAGNPIVFISADLGRMSRKYANRAYRLALMEAGAAMQNAYLVGAQLDLPVRAIAGIFEDALDPFLELPRDAHAVLAMLLGS